MDIYAFANQKGGVGKTTVTLGIGAALARRGRGAGSLVFDWPFGISTSDVQARAMRAYGIHAVRADCSKRPYVKVGDCDIEQDNNAAGLHLQATDHDGKLTFTATGGSARWR